MKRLLLLVLAALFVTSNVFAQDAQKPVDGQFIFSGSSYAYGAVYQLGKKDNSAGYGAYRIRPYFTYKTGNVETGVKLEIDQAFGSSATSGSTTNSKGQGDVGNDEKVVEVKAGYLKFMLPFLEGASIMGGAETYKSIGGLVVGTEIGGGFFNYKKDMLNLNLVVAQVWEPSIIDKKDTGNTQDDETFYGIDLGIKIGDINLRPGLYIIRFQDELNSTTTGATYSGPTDTIAYIPGIGLNAKFGDVLLDIAAQYGTASKDANDIKYSGYAADAAISYNAAPIKFGLFSTVLSGDDAKTTDKNESFKTFTLKYDGWGRMYILEAMMLFNNISDPQTLDVRKNSTGYMLAGAMIEFKMSSITLMVQAAWAQLSEKDANDETALGTEVDASLCYEIQKNAQIVLEGAYLASGKAVESVVSGEKQNATYLALGLNFKW